MNLVMPLLTLFGGLAFFLYGMHVMSSGLEKLAGGSLERTLKRMTAHKMTALLLGAGITVAIQSSSAMTVMLVGLVNSGIMELEQTVGVIMGSNVGTTLTTWILSLVGLDSDALWLQLLKPEGFAPIIALVGIAMIMVSRRQRRRDVGTIFVGFAVLMYGMTLMGDAVSPIAELPQFAEVMASLKNPLLGVLVGAVFTGVIQSSAASVGILQVLSLTGAVTYGAALPIIMGQNIGTCVTALISSIGVNRNAKRVAVVHVCFNLFGTVVCLALFYGAQLLFTLPFVDRAITPLAIALCHTVFNLVTTAVLLPLSNMLVKIANLVVRDKGQKQSYAFLDERLLATPSFAVSECHNLTVKMCELASQTILTALDLVSSFDEKKSERILQNEDELDLYEDKLGTFLVKLSRRGLSDPDSRQVSVMLHTIGDFERLGDHAVNLNDTARELHDKKIRFSEEANRELAVLTDALRDILARTGTAFARGDLETAASVEPLEEVIDYLIAEIKNRHIQRLQGGHCTIELGFALSDLLTNCERVSDHCSNIAVALIEVAQDSFETHEFLNGVKARDAAFTAAFEKYLAKYRL